MAGAGKAARARLLVRRCPGMMRCVPAAVLVVRNPERHEYAGEWSYDGTNFKRRYLQENGRQFSGGKIRYATFPLASVSPSELVVDDKIQGSKVIYRRVTEGTRP